MKKFNEFLKFLVAKLRDESGVATTQVLYQASGVSSTKGQLIQGNAKPVQGTNQVCVVKSSNVDYFQDAGTIVAPGVTTGNTSGGITIPLTGGGGSSGIPAGGDIYEVIPIAAGTLVLTAWLEVVTPYPHVASGAFTVNLGFTSNPSSSATVYGTQLDLTQPAGTILAGADSGVVPVISPIMCATATTLDLACYAYTADTNPTSPVVIVYALVVDLNF